MAISDVNVGLMEMALKHITPDPVNWNGLRLAELGNQHTLTKAANGREVSLGATKKIMSKKGVEHVSFDLNGQDDCTILNLCLPIPEKWKGYFDMVTNYGTSEHCEDQWQVWKNIHDMARVGGAIVCSIPHIGCWKGHCPYRYEPNFPNILAKNNGYKVQFLEIKMRNSASKLLINFILTKGTQNFQSRESFGDGIEFSSDFAKNIDNLF